MDRRGKKSRDNLVERKDVEWSLDEKGRKTESALVHIGDTVIPVVWHGFGQVCLCRICCLNDFCTASCDVGKSTPPCRRSCDECGYFVTAEDELDGTYQEPSVTNIFEDMVYKDVKNQLDEDLDRAFEEVFK